MAHQLVGDVEIYYEMHGQGDPLVLIHGLGSSARDWQYQIEPFSQRYRVVALDVRGHGQSAKPPGPYSIPLFAADTAGLMRALGLGPAHVVGISMGGMIGLQLAVDAPELLRSLVVVNAGPEMIVRTWRERWQLVQRQLIVRILGMRKMGEVLGARLFPKPEQGELRALFAEHWAENDPRAYREAMKALVGWSVADRLEAISCPVLVVAADQDYTPVESKAAYVQRLHHGELVVVEDSRHATPVEHPDRFNQVLGEFLQGR
ncbi:MAG: alpha/beta hydrolase [Anaerolineae bacterium]|nr:alpha/beta hydrolase [Anaerolineae bacterium]